MPLYSHIGPDGVIEEFWYSMSEAPPVGSSHERDGVTWTRIPDYASVTPAPVTDRHFVSQSLCRYDRYHAANGGKFDEVGRPQFRSRREVDEYCERASGEDASSATVYD